MPTEPHEPGRVFRTLRRVARKPLVRRVAEPLAAAYYGVRSRGQSAEERWKHGSTWEVAHWDDDWLTDARERGLLDATKPMADPLVLEAIELVTADPVHILDVGAGPLTPLGKVHPTRQLQITATDALAAQYDDLLARAGIDPPVRTVHADGENLLDVFEPGSFDVVHCGNALDHHYDPVRALEQMLAVARDDGVVVLNHFVDEAVFQRYLGMHQWNIADRDGALVIWNPTTTVDMTERLRGQARVESRLAPPEGGRQRLHTLIVKQ